MLKRSSVMLILFILQAAMAFMTNIVVARNLSVENFGIYAFWIATVSLLAVPACLGLDVLVAREGAATLHHGDTRKTAGLFWIASMIAFSVACALAVGIILLAYFQTGESIWWTIWTAVIAAASLPFLAINLIRQRISGVLGMVLVGSLPERLLRPGILLLGTWIVFNFTNIPRSPDTALIVFLAAAVVSFLLGWLLLAIAPKPNLGSGPREMYPRAWISAAFPLALMATAQIFNRQADVIALGLLATPKDVGIYQVSSRIAVLLGFIHVSFSMVITPHIAKLLAAQKIDEMQTVISASALISGAGTALGVIIIMLIGRPTIVWIFGPDYVNATGPLLILAFGLLINAATGPSVAILSMTKHANVATRIMVITIFLNIAINIVAIPLIGIYGAALATATSYFFFNTFLVTKCRKLVGVNPLALSRTSWELLQGRRKWPD